MWSGKYIMSEHVDKRTVLFLSLHIFRLMANLKGFRMFSQFELRNKNK